MTGPSRAQTRRAALRTESRSHKHQHLSLHSDISRFPSISRYLCGRPCLSPLPCRPGTEAPRLKDIDRKVAPHIKALLLHAELVPLRRPAALPAPPAAAVGAAGVAGNAGTRPRRGRLENKKMYEKDNNNKKAQTPKTLALYRIL